MTWRGRSLHVGWPALALAAAACTGYIGSASQTGGDLAGSNPGTGTGGGSGPGSGGTVASAPAALDPGRVTIRRLNRAEYDNTVRDLLGTSQTPGATTFPDDVPQVGFDNNGDLQTLSPLQFTLYQQAAESLAAEAITPGTAEYTSLFTCDVSTGTSCAQTLITNLGARAYRRPLTSAEVNSYLALMQSAAQLGVTPIVQFRTVIEAMLQSPNFLFRPEIDPNPTSLTPHVLSPYETASRLSYMIYRSMPDAQLFTAAGAGQLATAAQVQAQAQRMLADPKAVFGTTFGTMWLGTAAVPTETFDTTLFPTFSTSLAKSMQGEINSFFNEFLTEDEPLTQLLGANFSYIDTNLATLYGIPAPADGGTGLTRTVLNTPERAGGLLTMGGILSLTSFTNRTSIVRRGAWVLSQLLCAPPPPPPPNVPPFPTTTVDGGTQEQVLAEHRANPECAACHDSMDNIGSAMENYNAIGAWRTEDNGIPVDVSGVFTGPIAEPDGGVGPSFVGAVQLASTVAADPRYVPCVAQNVLSYSLGRAIQPSDTPYIAQITTAPQSGQIGVRDLVLNVVSNDTFRMRRGDDTTLDGGTP
jgi:hypothetical protein